MKILKKQISKLSIPAKDLSHFLSNYKIDKLTALLIFLFTALYLPHTFILNEDLGLLMAFETDPGTISETIIGLLDNYNFHDHYHSRTYGWTYYLINTILLTPVKAILDIFNFANSQAILLFFIKLIFFLIGLLSMLVFNSLLMRLFSNKALALTGSIFYIAGDLGYIFYFIHPETTGLLFVFLSILSMLNFLDKPNQYKYYIYGLISMTLSILSKQTFLFTSIPILGVFFATFLHNEKTSLTAFIQSEKFFKLMKDTLLAGLITLTVVNPLLIIDFNNALKYQSELLKIHTQEGFAFHLLTIKELIHYWILSIALIPLAVIYFALLPVTYFYTTYILSKDRKREYSLFLTMILSTYIIFILIVSGNRLYVLNLYLTPIFPFFIIHILALINYARILCIQGPGALRRLTLVLLIIICAGLLVKSAGNSVKHNAEILMNHRNYTAYRTYEFVLKNINKKDKVIHDHLVGFPSDMNDVGCNYWFTESCLDKFKPDYIIINRDFMVNGTRPRRLNKIIDYIEKNNLSLYREIKAENNRNPMTISVYKNTKSIKIEK